MKRRLPAVRAARVTRAVREAPPASAPLPTPEDFMRHALALAARGKCTTHPNPRVGCVIVRDGRVVGEGWHEWAGGPHAEVVALDEAGELARGADAYVTLEPCCHTGKTGPCTDVLMDAGVGRVIAAMEDPNPLVAGKGFAKLERAGIAVDVGLLEDEARALNRGFVSRMARGRPWVTLKLAHSLDGRSAMASGESKWITGPAARADVHRLRAEAGAVLTGVNTVLADNPQLTARELPPEAGEARQPDRIVLDTHLRTPPTAKVFGTGARRVLFSVRPRADQMETLQRRGVEVVLAGRSADGHVALDSVVKLLGRMDVNEVLVECGPTLAGAWLKSGLVDEVVSYVSPSFLGHEAKAVALLPNLTKLDQRVKLRFTEVVLVGDDLRITAVPEPR